MGPSTTENGLRSPRLALALIAYLALYATLATWSEALGIERPFASPLFLGPVALLFASTAACTWDRTRRLAALARQGALSGRPVLWGGWVLHAGILVLIAGVAVQQAFRDRGAFELAVGESVSLGAPRAVFQRDRGPLAPASPPRLSVGLLAFDPFLRQPGYAPDRASRLRVVLEGRAPLEETLDRAAGLEVDGVTIYQAIPSGPALVVELAPGVAHALHLHAETPRLSTGAFDSPARTAQAPVRLGVESERPFDRPAGPGRLTTFLITPAGRVPLLPGQLFDFGGAPARLLGVARWSGFTYAVDPGLPGVFAGFALIVIGAALSALPTAAAKVPTAESLPAGWPEHA